MKSDVDKTIEKYDEYYEEIFKDFKEFAGNIVVEFKDLNEYKQKTFIPIVKSVNDYLNVINFKRKLLLLKDNSFDILDDIIEKQSKRDKNKFLKDLTEKVKELNNFIYELIPPIPVLGDENLGFIEYKFSDFFIKDEKGQFFNKFYEFKELNDKKIIYSLFDSTIGGYSTILKFVINEIDKGIKQLLVKTKGEPETVVGSYNIKKEEIKKSNSKTSYDLHDPAKQTYIITKLFQRLKKKGFIDNKANSEDFKAIFTGYAKEPVNWIGEGGFTEILYLFYSLWGDKEETTKYVIKPKQPYKNLKNCFKINGNNIDTSSFKTLYNNIKKEETVPTKAKDIDRLIESLK